MRSVAYVAVKFIILAFIENPLATNREISISAGPQGANNGCGADLDWWFSKEADREWARLTASTAPRLFPELPAACKAISG